MSKRSAYDGKYSGRDSWNPEHPLREISDSYVYSKFKEHAKSLLSCLRSHYLSGSKVPVLDEDGVKTHQSQSRWVADDGHNPNWYSKIYWSEECTYQRSGPFKGRYVENKKIPPRNKANSQIRKYGSVIRRKRISKALEEIIGGTDISFSRFRRKVIKRKWNKKKKRYEWPRITTNYDMGRYVTIMRELIAERLAEGYLAEDTEGIDPQFTFCPPDNRVRAYFGMEELSEQELWELSKG